MSLLDQFTLLDYSYFVRQLNYTSEANVVFLSNCIYWLPIVGHKKSSPNSQILTNTIFLRIKGALNEDALSTTFHFWDYVFILPYNSEKQ